MMALFQDGFIRKITLREDASIMQIKDAIETAFEQFPPVASLDVSMLNWRLCVVVVPEKNPRGAHIKLFRPTEPPLYDIESLKW